MHIILSVVIAAITLVLFSHMSDFDTFSRAANALVESTAVGVVIQKAVGEYAPEIVYSLHIQEAYPVYVRPLSSPSFVCISHIWSRVALSFVVSASFGELDTVINNVALLALKYQSLASRKTVTSFVCNVYHTKTGEFLVVCPTLTASLHFVHKVLPMLVAGVSSHWTDASPGYKFAMPNTVRSAGDCADCVIFKRSLYFTRFVLGRKARNIDPVVVFIRDYATSSVEPASFPFVYSDGYST